MLKGLTNANKDTQRLLINVLNAFDIYQQKKACAVELHVCMNTIDNIGAWARGYKTFFMLVQTEHEIYCANTC